MSSTHNFSRFASIAACVALTNLPITNLCHASVSSVNEIKTLQSLIEDKSKPATLSLSESKWEPAPNSLPAGVELTVLEGDPNQPSPFIMRLKLPANSQIPVHWNLTDENITVISGTLNLGMGDKFDKHKMKALSAGSFARIPAKTHHYTSVTEETIIQFHGIGPWEIQYINPADAPNPPPQESEEILQSAEAKS